MRAGADADVQNVQTERIRACVVIFVAKVQPLSGALEGVGETILVIMLSAYDSDVAAQTVVSVQGIMRFENELARVLLP